MAQRMLSINSVEQMKIAQPMQGMLAEAWHWLESICFQETV
jgi:hypothetical protein